MSSSLINKRKLHIIYDYETRKIHPNIEYEVDLCMCLFVFVSNDTICIFLLLLDNIRFLSTETKNKPKIIILKATGIKRMP